jgi:DNA-binding transcriptional LysR family regulator
MNHLDMGALATVVAIADHASFTAAAAELNKTQAAVSFIVARLEKRVGNRVFERSPRGVTLTPVGEVLTGYARRILALESDALAALLGPATAGRIRLGVPDDYLDRFVTVALEQFTSAYPRVQVEIICDFSRRLEAMLEARELDLAIITRDGIHTRGELLRREEQCWCAATDRQPELADPLPLALFSDKCRARPLILEALDRAGLAWRLAYSCSHLHGIRAAVERGVAVTALPASTIPDGLRRLGRESGLPLLPTLDIALLIPEDARVYTRSLADILRRSFRIQQPATDSDG